jgi:hypothetical protein
MVAHMHVCSTVIGLSRVAPGPYHFACLLVVAGAGLFGALSSMMRFRSTVARRILCSMSAGRCRCRAVWCAEQHDVLLHFTRCARP